MTDERLAQIKALLAEVRPGPWQWFGNTKMRDVYLATVDNGRVFVMGFERWGMRGAQPIFQVGVDGRRGGFMRSLQELSEGGGGLGVQYEAPYRKDFVGIGHTDARFIAESRALVDELLAEVDRLRALVPPTEEDRMIAAPADT
jgi:hypothetical protein